MRTGSDLLDKISYDAKGGVDHLSLSVHMGRENMKTTLGREKKASFAPTASSLAAFVSLVSSSRVDKGQRSETFGFSVPWPSPKLLGNKLIRSSHENHASYFDATQSSFFFLFLCILFILRASLSCTLLQTLPELVMPLKGHSSSL